MSDHGQNPPAGWYPDPDNPGQQRYWDGAAWTAPQPPADPTLLTPTPANPVGGGGGGKTIGIVAIIAAVLLLGGGAYALTRDSGGTDELSAREFRRAVADICDDIGERFDDVEIGDMDPDRAARVYEGAMKDLIKDLRRIAPEDEVADWKDAVDELDDAVRRADFSSERAFLTVGSAIDRIERDFGVSCGGDVGDDDFVDLSPDDDVDFDDFDFDDIEGFFDDIDFDEFEDFLDDFDFEDLEDFFEDFDFEDFEDLFGS